MFNIGPWEFMLIMIVALIVVGPDKLPEVARTIGKSMNEFKRVTSGYKKEFEEAMKVENPPASKTNVEPVAPNKPADTIMQMADNFDTLIKQPEASTAVSGEKPANNDEPKPE